MLQLSFEDGSRDPVDLDRKRISIGRDEDNDIVLDDPDVSGFHCELYEDEDDHYKLVDLGSSNGTLVNGEAVSGRRSLHAWDRITIGGVATELVDPEQRRPTRIKSALADADGTEEKGTGWRVVGRSDSVRDQVFDLDSELTVGREGSCDITIESPDVSRTHARLRVEGDAVTVVDEGSANGTFINDEKISKGQAKPGDEIRFDEYVFGLEGPAADAAKTRVRPAVDAQATRVRPAVNTGDSGGQGRPPTDGSTRAMSSLGARLVAVSDGGGGPHQLDGRQHTVGRVHGNDIVIEHDTLSSHHARLVHESGTWKVEDQGSTNGTFVNGTAVTRTPLNEGDRLHFGEVEFRFEGGAADGAGRGKQAASGTRAMVAVGAETDSGAGRRESETRTQTRGTGLPAWIYGVGGFLVVTTGAALFLFWDVLAGAPGPIDAKLQVSSTWMQRLGPQRSQPATPVLADINGDNFLDIVVPDGQGFVMALDGKEGKRIFDAQLSGRIVAPAAASDLSGDGVADLVVATYSGLISALNGESKTLWQAGRKLDTGAIGNAPVFAELNGDDVRDVIVPTADRGLVALDGNRGWHMWSSGEMTRGRVVSRPLTGDFNGDGAQDFVSVTDRGQVMAVSAEDERVWQIWETDVPEVLYASPLHYRVDDTPLIAVATKEGVRALRADNGRGAWRFEQGGQFFASPVAVDANDDGTMDVIVTDLDGEVFALDGRHGDLIWQASLGASVKASPALHDIDQDGREDLVFLDQEGRVHVLTMDKGRVELSARLAQDAKFTASPLLGDVNRDGYLDIVAASEDGRIFTHSFNRTTDKGEAVWPTFTGNLGAVAQ